METSAIIMMVVGIVIIWGGLAGSILWGKRDFHFEK